MEPYWSEAFGNPASVHYELGIQASEALEAARADVALYCGAKAEQIAFTSNGTESCSLAIMGAFLARPEKNHIVVTAVEHQAVRQVVSLLKRNPFGAQVTFIPVSPDGALSEAALETALRPNTGIVSCMLANNETGVVFPVAELVRSLKNREIFFHCDAIQAVGKIPLDFSELGVNALSISGHKLGAPKGVAALLLNSEIPWISPMQGGGQENGRRGGTPAVGLAVGLGAAMRTLRTGSYWTRFSDLASIRDSFESECIKRIPGATVNGASQARLPNTSSITLPPLSVHTLLRALGARGVMASSGAACSSQNLEPSHVLTAMGLSPAECLSTIRFSFGPDTQVEDIPPLVDVLCEEVEHCRSQNEERLKRIMN